MYRRFFLSAAVALGLLGGCATTAVLDPQIKSTIRTVAINRGFDLPERPFVPGEHSDAAVLLGGAIGSKMEQKLSTLPEQYVQLLAERKIDVREVTRSALRTQLNARGFAVVEDPAQADAVVKVNHFSYGMVGAAFLDSSKRSPYLGMQVELVRRASNASVWRNDVVSYLVPDIRDALEQRSLQDFFSNEALLRREHEKIASLVAERLTRGL
jgi:hypothetical protein